MAVMLVRAFQLTGGEKPVTFNDRETIGPWASESVATMLDQGVIKGYEDNTFRPKNPATRAEVAVLLHRLVSMK